MDRKEFIRQCGMACLGTIGIASILEGCAAPKTVASTAAQVKDGKLSLPLLEFKQVKNDETIYRRYVVVRNAQLKFPVVVYRNSESSYTALSLRCTHKSAELNVSGEMLSCPAHGSEFNPKGEVITGPAKMKLDEYKTTLDANSLLIHLT